LYFGAKQQPTAVAEVDNCPLPLPEAGSARAWEADVGVSPYSRVNTRTRNLFTAIPLAHVPMRGPDADIVLYHNSANVGAAAPPTTNMGFDLGPGWTPAHSDQIVFGVYDATVMYANGTRDVFTWNGTVYAPAHGVYDRLIPVDSLTWHVVHKDQSYHEFRNDGDAIRLVRFVDSAGLSSVPDYEDLDPNPSQTAVDWRFESVGRISNTVDPTHTGKVKFHYNAAGKLVRIEDEHAGAAEPPFATINDAGHIRDWNLTYHSLSGRLCKIENPNAHFMYFWYDSEGRITGMTEFRTALAQPDDPCAVTSPEPSWDAYVFDYDAQGRVVTVHDPDQLNDPDDGMTQHFDGNCGNLKVNTTYMDRRGSEWEYLYDGSQFGLFPDANLVRTRGPVVDSYTRRVFDIDRNVLSVMDAVDKVWTATFDGNGNRLTWTDPLDHGQTWEYDTLNNITAYVDAVGNRTEYHYDLLVYPDPYTPLHHSALLTSIVEPSTIDIETLAPSGPATTTLYYGGSGDLLRSVTDPLGVVTRFEYDPWGQVTLYTEGDVPSQTAGGSVPGYSQSSRSDSAGRPVTSGEGYNLHDPGGNQSGSGCIPRGRDRGVGFRMARRIPHASEFALVLESGRQLHDRYVFTEGRAPRAADGDWQYRIGQREPDLRQHLRHPRSNHGTGRGRGVEHSIVRL